MYPNQDAIPNQNAIFERLETTKKFGLLADYLVSWSGQSGRLSPKVTVWGRDGTPEDVKFAETLESVCVDVVESGKMTKDLAILIRADHPFLTTDAFMDAIGEELKRRMG